MCVHTYLSRGSFPWGPCGSLPVSTEGCVPILQPRVHPQTVLHARRLASAVLTSVSQQVGCCCGNQYGVLRCIPLPVYHQQAGSARCPFIIKDWTVSLCPLTRFCINLPGGPWLPSSTSQLFGFPGGSGVACSRTAALGARGGNWLVLCCASRVTSGGTGLPFGLSGTAA